jgi:alkylhydroperoxidase/carboxymuconolactone decarboxylase family protein YurZ
MSTPLLKNLGTARTIDPIESGVTVDAVRAEVEEMLDDVPAGEPLDQRQAALVEFAIRATPTVLHGPELTATASAALDAGVSPEQLHEALVLVSGIGLHSMIEGTRRLGELFAAREEDVVTRPLDGDRQALLDEYVGPELAPFEAAVPGFFENLVRLSPTAFEGFFAYRSLPWLDPRLDPLTKELMAIAVDALPSHRFLPTLRLHVARAIELGAGRTAILATLDRAAAAPDHPGVA